MKIALSIPDFPNIDSVKTSIAPLPQGTPTGGLFGTGEKIFGVGIQLMFIVAILVATFFIVRGGINMLTSGGHKEKFMAGRERVRYALIGLIIIFLSFVIINTLGGFFGLNLLSFYH